MQVKKWTFKAFIKKILKITGWTVVTLIVLLVAVVLIVRIPSVQNKIVQKVVALAESKLGTKVSIESIFLSFPKQVVVNKLFVADQQRDTLLYVGNIKVSTDLWALLHHSIQLNEVSIDELRSHVRRVAKDSAYNFDFIIDKFKDTTTTIAPDTTSASWKFTLGEINVTHSSALYDDQYGGDKGDIFLNSLTVDMEKFEPAASVYHVRDIVVDGLNARFIQSKNIQNPPSVPSGPAPDIGIGKIDLKNIQLHWEQQATGQIASINSDKIILTADTIDLNKHILHLNELSIAGTTAIYQQMVHQQQPVAIQPQPSSTAWSIRLASLSLTGMGLQYYDFNEAVLTRQADFNHLWISRLNGNASNISVNTHSYTAKINDFSFFEKNGFSLEKLAGNFKISNRRADIQQFVLQTANSNIHLTGSAEYSSLSSLSKDWKQAGINLNIAHSSVSLADLRFLLADQMASVPAKFDKSITLQGQLKGKVNDLTFQDVRINALAHTGIRASGNIKGLPDFNKALMDVSIDSLYTTLPDVAILPDSLISKSVHVPDWIDLHGTMKGTIRNAVVSAIVETTDGQAEVKGHYDLDSANIGGYEGTLVLHDMNVGKLLRQDSIGRVSLAAHVKGAGLTMKDLNSAFDLNVSEFDYMNYRYRNFSASGALKNFFYTGKASFKDDNLDFDISGEFDQRQDVPSYSLKAELRAADFKALHLSARALKARGTLAVKLATPDFKKINGSVAVRNVAIFNGQTLYKVDSMLFASINSRKTTEIKINSDIIDGSFKGTIDLFGLPDVLERHLNSYFSLQDTIHNKPLDTQDFTFSLVIKNTDLITGILFPSLHSFQSSPVTGTFNSAEKKLDIHAEVRRLHYENIRARSIVLDINSTKKSLTYALDLDDFRYDSLKIPGLDLQGTVANDSIKTKLIVQDSLGKQKYLLGAVFNSLKSDFQFRFIPGQVFLNYTKWDVPDDNYIRFSKEGMRANHFSISHENEQITMETQGRKDSVIHIGFKQLDLENISNIVSGKKPIVTGRLDGDFSLFIKKNNAFNASAKIADLNIMAKSWGQITLEASQLTADKFTMSLISKGTHTDLSLKGNYVTQKPKSILDLHADIRRMDMELVEPFSSGQIKNASGQVTGAIDISGTVDKPVIKGEITFKEAGFTSAYVNTTFTLKNETLRFTGSGISLSNFTILDESKNSAVLKGTVTTKNFRTYDLDLGLSMKNFRVLNTTAANSTLYFGSVKMNATAKITGPLTQPVVELKMGFSNDTNFSYIVPIDRKGVIDQKGIVQFVDKRPPKDKFMASLHLQDTVQNIVKGLDLTATIELNEAQKFNIIIDPKSGDKLSVQGNTTLVVKIDPAGNMNLSGQFEIAKGSYNFSFYKLVKRDFEIVKGGTITWSGDPMDARLDIQALYKLETSPLELLATQSTDLNPYRQSIPFLVYLNIKGDLTAPEISFLLDMPEGSKSVLGGNVYAAIQDINTREPDLNKQVFSLLVLKRFMADNPFENQVTTSFSSNAKSSVSGLLTEQLQRLSSNVKGIQLSVDVKSFDDYTTGTPSNQTQLQLGVSKSLLHDKLVVKLAGNVDIAGENTTQNSLTDYIGDLALEYKITADGRLRLTGFRNSDYDMIDGELIKTGAGLIYIKDYNTLKELFKANDTQK